MKYTDVKPFFGHLSGFSVKAGYNVTPDPKTVDKFSDGVLGLFDA